MYKLKVEILEKNEILTLDQSFSCKEEVADIFAEILDRIIIDEYIKASPMTMELPCEKQREIILKRKREVLQRMKKRKINFDYIYSSDSSDLLTKTVDD